MSTKTQVSGVKKACDLPEFPTTLTMRFMYCKGGSLISTIYFLEKEYCLLT